MWGVEYQGGLCTSNSLITSLCTSQDPLTQNADALSRIPPDHTAQIDSLIETLDGIDVAQCQQSDTQTSEVIKAIKSGHPLPKPFVFQANRFHMKDGILVRKIRFTSDRSEVYQVVIPLSLRETVLKYIHDQSGHFGVHKTQGKIQYNRKME